MVILDQLYYSIQYTMLPESSFGRTSTLNKSNDLEKGDDCSEKEFHFVLFSLLLSFYAVMLFVRSWIML